MKLSESVKPISYLKAHASEIIRDVSENQKTIVITQHGEAKAVVQNLASYEQMNDTIAMLKLLAQSTKSKLLGRYKPANKTFSDLRHRIKELQ
jgi:prevent-host-death family protein